MRTKKRCTAQQFEQAVNARQFGDERVAAARRVLVDGVSPIEVAKTSTISLMSIRRAVHLIYEEVESQARRLTPARTPRPGFVILIAEVPELASAGLRAAVESVGGLLMEEKNGGNDTQADEVC